MDARGLDGSQTSRRAGLWLAVLRIAVGGWFVKTMITKVSWQIVAFLPVPRASDRWIHFLPVRLAEYAQANPIAWYRDFLLNAVIPHATVFAWLTAFGEMAVGIGLVLGFFTEYAAALGLILTTVYALATFHLGMSQQGFHFLLASSMVVIAGSHAGMTWGIDALLRRRPLRRTAPALA